MSLKKVCEHLPYLVAHASANRIDRAPVLRLYPSVPVNSREATQLTTLPTGGGPDEKSPVLVRPGEGVGYCVYVMHRQKNIYGADADDFRPERWEEDALKDIGYAYLPFNAGPRLCLGRMYPLSFLDKRRDANQEFTEEFAYLLVSYTVARMVQVFPNMRAPEMEPVTKVGEEKQILTLVVSSAEGCIVRLGD